MGRMQRQKVMARFKDTFEQLLARAKTEKPRKPANDEEHRIQCACVQWFRYEHQQLRPNLFAIPNGGRRDKVTGAKLKEEGVLAGVADLILLYPSGEYHALLIEMKTAIGRQSSEQRKWQQQIEPYGYKYVVCHSLGDFITAINDYLLI